jgi:hypothetical protein
MLLPVDRRTIVSGIAAVVAAQFTGDARAQVSNDSEISFRWAIPKALAPVAANELSAPVEFVEEDGRGAGLVILVGSVAAVYLARSILRLRDEIEGGTFIDTRSDEVLVERDADLPGGTILVLSSDGANLLEREEIADPADLIKALTPGG